MVWYPAQGSSGQVDSGSECESPIKEVIEAWSGLVGLCLKSMPWKGPLPRGGTG